MIKRVDSLSSRKLAKFKIEGAESDSFIAANDRKALDNGSRKLALAIVRSGKAHGPVDEVELIAYARTAKTRTQNPNTPRKEAILAGKTHYNGKVHEPCGTSRRFTNTAECVACQAARQRRARERKANRQAIEQRCDEQMLQIVARYELSLDEVLSPSRLAKYHLCRTEIWQMMRREGLPLATIAERFGRDHTSVMSALGLLKCKPKSDTRQGLLLFAA